MADLSDLIEHIPDLQNNEQHSNTLKCCCGRKDCAFLVHNGEIVDKLEGDVTLAAQMGQVGFPSLSLPLSRSYVSPFWCLCYYRSQKFYIPPIPLLSLRTVKPEGKLK